MKTISSQLFKRSKSHYIACIFTSIKDDNIYLAYLANGTYSKNLEYYDITSDKKIILFNQLFDQSFSSCRYYLDKKKNRDLLIISSSNKYVTIVNFEKENSNIISFLNFKKRIGNISTSYIINNNILIPFGANINQRIEIYDFNNKFIKYLEEEELGKVFSINNYFWEKKNLNYAIISYSKGIVVYDGNFTNFKKFFKGPKNNDEDFLESNIINNNEQLILVGCYYKYNPGYLYFWNFEKGDLSHSLSIGCGITGLDLYNNDFIFISLYNGNSQFALIDINEKKIIKEFIPDEKDKKEYGIHILRHKTKGDYLISILEKGKLYLFEI